MSFREYHVLCQRLFRSGQFCLDQTRQWGPGGFSAPIYLIFYPSYPHILMPLILISFRRAKSNGWVGRRMTGWQIQRSYDKMAGCYIWWQDGRMTGWLIGRQPLPPSLSSSFSKVSYIVFSHIHCTCRQTIDERQCVANFVFDKLFHIFFIIEKGFLEKPWTHFKVLSPIHCGQSVGGSQYVLNIVFYD